MPKRKSPWEGLYTLRSDGRYMGYYKGEGGKRKPVYGHTEKEVYEKIQAKEAALAAPKVVLFKDIAQAWHDAMWFDLPPGTQASYAAHYSRAVDRMGDMEAEEIEPVDIQNHLDFLATQQYTASTIKKQKTIYALIFSHAIIHGLLNIRVSPVDATKIPKKTKPAQKRTAPETEVVKLIQSAAATTEYGYYALLLLCTGARRGEAFALRWEDVLDTGYIRIHESVTYHGGTHINTPKTKAGIREVPILKPLEPYLVMPEGAKKTDYIIHGVDPSKPIASYTYAKRWLSYCRSIGLVTDTPEEYVSEGNHHKYTRHHYKPTLTAHMLRHGYATMLFEADVDEETATAYMGHTDIALTHSVYTHLRKLKEQEGKNKLVEHTKNGLT